MPWLLTIVCLMFPLSLWGGDPPANKEHLKKYINRSQTEEASILKTLDELASKVAEAQGKLKITHKSYQGSKSRLYQSRKEVERLQKQVDRYRRVLSAELESLYILHRVRGVTLLPGLMGDEKYFRNQQLLRRATALDADRLEKMEKTLQRLEKQKGILIHSSERLGYFSEEEARVTSSMELEQRHLNDYLSRLRRDRTLKERYLKESKAELARLEGVIRKHQGPLEKHGADKHQPSNQGLYDEPEPLLRGFRGLKGRLPTPLAGSLQQKFGNEKSFGGLYKKGLLVKTQSNLFAKAILGGKIAFAGPFRGFGEMVILDHGKGSMSLYGNLNGVILRKGDIVTQGQDLGVVRIHPQADSPLFYFETRYRARAEDPLRWLKSPGWKD